MRGKGRPGEEEQEKKKPEASNIEKKKTYFPSSVRPPPPRRRGRAQPSPKASCRFFLEGSAFSLFGPFFFLATLENLKLTEFSRKGIFGRFRSRFVSGAFIRPGRERGRRFRMSKALWRLKGKQARRKGWRRLAKLACDYESPGRQTATEIYAERRGVRRARQTFGPTACKMWTAVVLVLALAAAAEAQTLGCTFRFFPDLFFCFLLHPPTPLPPALVRSSVVTLSSQYPDRFLAGSVHVP
jgi:hypothetical protein